MANIANILKAEITRLSRRELKSATDGIRKASGQHRAELASLKRRVEAIEKHLKHIDKLLSQSVKTAPEPAARGNAGFRYSASRFQAHRQRLELSAAEVGLLLNVTQQTVYNWESGKTRPSPGQMPAIAAMRKLTKRNAREILNQWQKSQ